MFTIWSANGSGLQTPMDQTNNTYPAMATQLTKDHLYQIKDQLIPNMADAKN